MGAARDLHHSYGDSDGELTSAGKQHQKQRVRDKSIWRQQLMALHRFNHNFKFKLLHRVDQSLSLQGEHCCKGKEVLGF